MSKYFLNTFKGMKCPDLANKSFYVKDFDSIENLTKKYIKKIEENSVTNGDVKKIRSLIKLIETQNTKENKSLKELSSYLLNLEAALIEELGDYIDISLSPETRNIRSIIEIFSDKERQVEGWLKGNKLAKTISWEDEISELFGLNLFEDYLEKNKSLLPSKLYSSLELLKKYLDNYEEKETEKEIIEDPKWHEIIKLAQETIKIWDSSSF